MKRAEAAKFPAANCVAGSRPSQYNVGRFDPTSGTPDRVAGGLTGTVTVYGSPKKTTFGTPAATATVVADTAGAGTEAVIFTYDTGDTLANATTAAGRRVGFFFDTNAPTVASSDGWVLFDNTITWTANSPPPITQRSTIRMGGMSVATVSQGEVTWLVADNLGSPTVTYRADGNTPASVALYYPYGSPRTPQIEGTGTGFTGQVSDLESGTGLAFYNARYYDPALGRFTQPDTIIPNPSNGQDYNRYSYVRNNPVNFTDPTGNFPEWLLAALLGSMIHLQIQMDVGLKNSNWQGEKAVNNSGARRRFDLVNLSTESAVEIKKASPGAAGRARNDLDRKIRDWDGTAAVCRPSCPSRIRPHDSGDAQLSGTIEWGDFTTTYWQAADGVILYTTNFDVEQNNFKQMSSAWDDARALRDLGRNRERSFNQAILDAAELAAYAAAGSAVTAATVAAVPAAGLSIFGLFPIPIMGLCNGPASFIFCSGSGSFGDGLA